MTLKFATYEEWKKWFDSTATHDEYGFQVRPDPYWKTETIEEEIERLQMNQWIYREYLKNKSTFPRKVHEAREDEFKRLRMLRLAPPQEGLNEAQLAHLRGEPWPRRG